MCMKPLQLLKREEEMTDESSFSENQKLEEHPQLEDDSSFVFMGKKLLGFWKKM